MQIRSHACMNVSTPVLLHVSSHNALVLICFHIKHKLQWSKSALSNRLLTRSAHQYWTLWIVITYSHALYTNDILIPPPSIENLIIHQFTLPWPWIFQLQFSWNFSWLAFALDTGAAAQGLDFLKIFPRHLSTVPPTKKTSEYRERQLRTEWRVCDGPLT